MSSCCPLAPSGKALTAGERPANVCVPPAASRTPSVCLTLTGGRAQRGRWGGRLLCADHQFSFLATVRGCSLAHLDQSNAGSPFWRKTINICLFKAILSLEQLNVIAHSVKGRFTAYGFIIKQARP
ncbi:hypothetical protein NECAME_08366 [Necator americanus]|uniref:Uncharacterized protein n=1 Tax=Necator americanus TaxID=51031 RepID=W2TKC3_NECAM|nr:hypothetical protein NECAME_08366 [Necator americanus]ETN81621.1 hypothetical protein NECAME_08366 [Necator americanus]